MWKRTGPDVILKTEAAVSHNQGSNVRDLNFSLLVSHQMDEDWFIFPLLKKCVLKDFTAFFHN